MTGLGSEAESWEVALAGGLMIVATVGTVLLAARIYRGSLLETGKHVSLKRAWLGAEA